MNTIITIGREFGSGGREFGRKLAEILGYEYYDKEIIKEIAKRTSLMENYVQQIIENNPHDLFPITVAHSFSYIDTYLMEQKHSIFIEQENVIKDMANKSNCVIVGRCADFILKDYNPIKLFVYADMESKLKRCMDRIDEKENIPEKKVIKNIKSIDKNRAKYYSFYTGNSWGNKLNYDFMINTTNENIGDLAKKIAIIIK